MKERTALFSSPPPRPFSASDSERFLQAWREQADKSADPWMVEAAAPEHPVRPLLDAVSGNSPYLSRLLLLNPAILQSLATHGADAAHSQWLASLASLDLAPSQPALMESLRLAKGQLALLTGLADIGGLWPLENVTAALSDFAGICLTLTVNFLLREGHKRGEIILPHPDAPSRDSGLIVLGMGKLGGGELNYSSDIDLILFYEPTRLAYKGRQTEQHFMNRLAHALVDIMQERTRHGYVFRTDLRLRPDPASTPPVVAIDAAYRYYESVGQNWERAAMIKARPLAGDIDAGERFLSAIKPFMWRRSLDFASINDIHSIKRQMDSGQARDLNVASHNIKLGTGGIREIEFFTQIHQLIWGGREPSLRSRPTCETLSRLCKHGLITPEHETLLTNAYAFLRKLEHRLQMVADEQTHSMPATDEGIAHIACFMGYASTSDFERDLLSTLTSVHALFASSFKSAGELGEAGNLVFTGVSHDPDTLQTLRAMGYRQPEAISETVMGWHHGSTRATRTKRSRELLTELMPLLLKRLSETANPDAAFLKFNDFLSHLPSGVQLFSLFSANPHLLGLIADIMGSAPTLADSLSKSPDLLDSVLYADFYAALPDNALLSRQLEALLAITPDFFEERMEQLRRFRAERQFQAGVQMLKSMIDARYAGVYLSALADTLVERTLAIVTAEFEHAYGRIEAGRFAIIALGKLGSREMTFSSDIDLIFVYDADPTLPSSGEKPFTASVYFNRLAQRMLSALTAMGRFGRLYEVDTRLRPSGQEGLLAVNLPALEQYFAEQAWNFERMAFTKARTVAGEPGLRRELEHFIRNQLAIPRDGNALRNDAADMRRRITREHPASIPWDIKYVHGGLMDIDFIAQTLLLLNAPTLPNPQPGSASDAFAYLSHHNRLNQATADALIAADRFLGQVFNMLRLCSKERFDETSAPQGLKKLLAASVNEPDFDHLKTRLLAVETAVHAHYMSLVEFPSPGRGEGRGGG